LEEKSASLSSFVKRRGRGGEKKGEKASAGCAMVGGGGKGWGGTKEKGPQKSVACRRKGAFAGKGKRADQKAGGQEKRKGLH